MYHSNCNRPTPVLGQKKPEVKRPHLWRRLPPNSPVAEELFTYLHIWISLVVEGNSVMIPQSQANPYQKSNTFQDGEVDISKPEIT